MGRELLSKEVISERLLVEINTFFPPFSSGNLMEILGVVDMSGTSVFGMLAVPWHKNWWSHHQLPLPTAEALVRSAGQLGSPGRVAATLTSGW